MTQAAEQSDNSRNGAVDYEHEVTKAVARLKAGVWAVILGLIMGVGLFAMTAILLIEAGSEPDAFTGFHLNLLGNYFPGYAVTWPGAFVGLLYGAAFGAIVGWSTAWIYNQITEIRERRRNRS